MSKRDPDNEDPRVIVCCGPPRCLYDGAKSGSGPGPSRDCDLCKQIIVHPDGSETVIEPRIN